MKCEVCGERDASVRLTHEVNGKMAGEVNLCFECAAERGIDIPEAMSLTDLLTGFSAGEPTHAGTPLQKRCATCGMGIDEFRIWGKKHHIDFDRLYQDVKKQPNNIKRKAIGQTYKYWASILPVDPMQSLNKLSIQILAAIGENDDMVPVESVHFLRNEFERLNKENLTVKIFPDCDHVMNDSAGVNHRDELFQLASRWWAVNE